MSRSIFPKFTFSITILFACAAIPAFAQRGGGGGGGSHGGGGGGFHGGGGGGFHGGGGGGSRMSGGSRGGGFSSGTSSPRRMGAGYSRSMPSVSSRTGIESSARPGGNVYRSYGSSVGGGQGSSFSSAAHSSADGQWHSFGGAAAGRGSTGSSSEARSSAGTGWQTFGGNRSAGQTRSTRSFSGQGHDVWENAPLARNVVPSSRGLSNARGAFTNSVSGNSRLQSNTSFSSSRFAAGTALGNRTFPGSSRLNRFGPFRDNPQFGSSFGFRGGFRRGCWNCGFGWGFGLGWGTGWGFGWPWLGYWGWGPSWIDPIWGWPGYNYYGYPAGYSIGNSYDDNYGYSAPPESYPSSEAYAQPTDQYPTQSPDTGKIEMPVLFYMKDGSVYAASDYWVEDGKLHYVLSTGAEHVVELDQVDVKRTVAENAEIGVQVTWKPRPGLSAPSPETPSPTAPTAKPRNNVISHPSIRS
jgi:hypothetical protein